MIKFPINRSLSLQALNATKRAISTKSVILILSTIKIEVQNSNITLTGSNGQISIENTIPTPNENAGLLITLAGAVLLEVNFSINIVPSLPDVTLDFEEVEHHQIALTGGESEVTLKRKDVDLYPHP